MADSKIMDLFRAAIRNEWDAVDRAIDQLGSDRWLGGITGITAVFGLAVQRMFPADYQPHDVVRFVADARAELANPDDIPPNEAEALVLAALGDTDYAESVPAEIAVPTQIALTLKIVSDEKPSDLDLERFLDQAEALAARWRKAGTS